MSILKRIVISGGPATGKTSLIYGLQKQGYSCFHEVSREIIREQLEANSGILPWQNLTAFSELVFEGRKSQFLAAFHSSSFYDRSLIDTLAYMVKDGLPIPEHWLADVQDHRYDNPIFITPPWKEIFANDHERRESWEQVLHIHEFLMSSYAQYGYDVVLVPKVTVEERIEFILSHVE